MATTVRVGGLNLRMKWDPAQGVVAEDFDVAAERAAATLTGHQESVAAEFVSELEKEARALEREGRLNFDYLLLGVRGQIGDTRSADQIRRISHPCLLAVTARSRHDRIRKATAANPHTPPDILERLLEEGPAGVRQAVVANPGCPEERILHLIVTQKQTELFYWAAANPALSERIQLFLASGYHAEARVKLAANPNLCLSAAQKLLRSDDVRLNGQLADNPTLPLDLRRQALAKSAHMYRIQAAQDPDIPVAMLIDMSTDPALTLMLLSNPSFPEQELERLAASEQTLLRSGVARHMRCPDALLEHLAQDSEGEVRIGVAANPHLSPALARQLAGDPIARVRLELAWRTLDPEVQALLARDPEGDVRGRLARRVIMPDLLALLAANSESRVREGVAENKETPGWVIGRLLEDPDPKVRAAARRAVRVRRLPKALLREPKLAQL